MNLESSLASLKGIGEKTEKLFEKAGIHTVGDLIGYYPRTYERFAAPIPVSAMQEGDV